MSIAFLAVTKAGGQGTQQGLQLEGLGIRLNPQYRQHDDTLLLVEVCDLFAELVLVIRAHVDILTC